MGVWLIYGGGGIITDLFPVCGALADLFLFVCFCFCFCVLVVFVVVQVWKDLLSTWERARQEDLARRANDQVKQKEISTIDIY